MPRKKSKASTKGSAFERQICKELSLWWSYEDRDDIFWRTSNSGGRAAGRGKKGKKTFGQYGDIQAVDPIGQPLMDVLTFELKCGYPGVSILDCFESGKLRGLRMWVEQAKQSAHLADVGSWALIWKRNRRLPVILLPEMFVEKTWGRVWEATSERMLIESASSEPIIVLLFQDWLELCSPVALR